MIILVTIDSPIKVIVDIEDNNNIRILVIFASPFLSWSHAIYFKYSVGLSIKYSPSAKPWTNLDKLRGFE